MTFVSANAYPGFLWRVGNIGSVEGFFADLYPPFPYNIAKLYHQGIHFIVEANHIWHCHSKLPSGLDQVIIKCFNFLWI